MFKVGSCRLLKLTVPCSKPSVYCFVSSVYASVNVNLCDRPIITIAVTALNHGSRANKSDVWINFEKLSATQARCKHCSKVLAVSGGVTSSMHGHIRSKHPSLVPSSSSQSASPLPTINAMFTQHTCSDKKQEKISDALAKFIAEKYDHRPKRSSNKIRILQMKFEF